MVSVVQILNYAITLLCFAALGLSIYSYLVELQIEQNATYKAACDIGEHMSCTSAFKSYYGRGFGLAPKGSFLDKPNSLMGILFYSLTATLAQSNSPLITQLSLWTICLANLASLYFAYILIFVLYNFCVVCVSIHVINVFCLILMTMKIRFLTRVEVPKKAN